MLGNRFFLNACDHLIPVMDPQSWNAKLASDCHPLRGLVVFRLIGSRSPAFGLTTGGEAGADALYEGVNRMFFPDTRYAGSGVCSLSNP